jgi:hypothetical protein
MSQSRPANIIQFEHAQTAKNRKLRQIPAKIFGVSEASLFDKRDIGFFADLIKAFRREKEDPPGLAYEMCEQRGQLATLQKMLAQSGDAHESTRGKLLIAYKAALAESDAYIGSLADAVDFSKPPTGKADPSYIGWMFWGLMSAFSLSK